MKQIICKKCYKVKPHRAKGLCSGCYQLMKDAKEAYQRLLRSGGMIIIYNRVVAASVIKLCENNNIQIECEVRKLTKREYICIEMVK